MAPADLPLTLVPPRPGRSVVLDGGSLWRVAARVQAPTRVIAGREHPGVA